MAISIRAANTDATLYVDLGNSFVRVRSLQTEPGLNCAARGTARERVSWQPSINPELARLACRAAGVGTALRVTHPLAHRAT